MVFLFPTRLGAVMCATGFTISSGEVQLNNWFCVDECPAGLLHPEGMMVGRIYPAPHM